MRIGVFLVSFALLTAPALAGRAAPEEPKAKPAAKQQLPTNLRGSIQPQSASPSARQTASRFVAPPGPAGLALKPSVAAATPPPGPGAGQCRSDCAHAYYFCLSGEINADCSATWSQCVVSCGHPPLTIEH